MNRIQLLQKLVDHYHYDNYLEIGVHKGKTFLQISCKNKIAVDPAFKITPGDYLRFLYHNRTNWKNRYYQMKSDEFFSRKMSKFKSKNYPELVFIDGLHTYQASLNDVYNSLKYLKPKGTIVLHDCFPPTKAAATPAESLDDAKRMDIEGWTGAWCGDVWKTIAYLNTKFSKELEVTVLNADLGLGIIQLKENSCSGKDIDKELFDRINKLNYDELMKDPENMIQLKNVDYFSSFLHN